MVDPGSAALPIIEPTDAPADLPTLESLHEQTDAAPASAVAEHVNAAAPGDPMEQAIASLNARLSGLERLIARYPGLPSDGRTVLDRLADVEHALADMAAAFPKLSALSAKFGVGSAAAKRWLSAMTTGLG